MGVNATRYPNRITLNYQSTSNICQQTASKFTVKNYYLIVYEYIFYFFGKNGR